MARIVTYLRSLFSTKSKTMAGGESNILQVQSWSELVSIREDKIDIDPEEGPFTLNGLRYVNKNVKLESGDYGSIILPDEILEAILSLCDSQDILKINKVCRTWKTVTTKSTFWKSFYQTHNIDYKKIPKRIVEKPNSWIGFYAIAKHQLLNRNLIRNPSGTRGFESWVVVENGGDGVIVENPPAGCDPLPNNSTFHDRSFTTSFDWGIIRQTLKLKDVGLTPKVVDLFGPFKFCLSVMIGTRFDCAARGKCSLKVRNARGDALEKIVEFTSEAGSNWAELRTEIEICQLWIEDGDLNDVVVTLMGSDRQFWNGHYGIKFARVSLKLDLPAQKNQPPEIEGIVDDVTGYAYEVETRFGAEM